MPPTPPPKLVIACPPLCQFHPDKIGEGAAAALLAVRESGYGVTIFSRRATQILGRPIVGSSASRHLNHYREYAPLADPEPGEIPEKVGDVALLDRIIASGARNSKNWKPTIGDTLKAMEMKLRLTGNSAFEDMLAAMNAGLDMADAVEDEPEESLTDVVDGDEAAP